MDWDGSNGDYRLGFLNDGGTEFVTFEGDTGNVGIGTTAPGVKLDVSLNNVGDDGLRVVQAGAGSASVRLSNTGTGGREYFIGSSGTGFGGGGAGKLFIYDNSGAATRMVIDSTGNVGIGTTGPLGLLDVSKSTAGGDNTAFFTNEDNTNAASGQRVFAQVGGSSAGDPRFVLSIEAVKEWNIGIDNSDSDKFMIGTDSTVAADTKLTIQSDGNVGIGTTGPLSKLQIGSPTGAATAYLSATANFFGADTSEGGTLNLYSTSAAAVGKGAQLTFSGEGGNAQTPQYFSYIRGTKDDATAGYYGGNLQFWTMSSGETGGESNSAIYERMRITRTGNVGIGTTGPGARLELTTTAALETIFDSTHAGGGYLQFERSGVGKGYIGSRYHLIAGTAGFEDDFTIRVEGNLSLAAGGATERVFIKSDGNVGIGTTAPGQLLTLNGNTRGLRLQDTAGYYMDTTIDYNRANYYEFTFTTHMGGLGDFDAMTIDGSGAIGMGYTNFTTAPTGKLLVNGNVGIGTTGPQTKLHVHSASDTRISITDDTSGSTSGDGLYIRQTGVNSLIGNQETGYLALFVDNDASKGVYIKSGGNVGIGTTAPTSKLHISGDVNATGDVRGNRLCVGSDCRTFLPINNTFTQYDTWNFNQSINLQAWVTAQSYYNTEAQLTNLLDNNYLELDGTGSMTGNIRLNGNYLSGDGGNEGVFVSTTGNIGIGTTAPQGRMDVVATSGPQAILSYTGGSVQTNITTTSAGDTIIDNTGGDFIIRIG